MTTIGYPNLLRSEWIKLRTVRSTYWTAAAAVLASIGVAAIACAHAAAAINAGQAGVVRDPATFSLNGIFLAQIAAGALGVLVISSEYGTGMIRATLSAVPQRLALLSAKGLVFLGATLLAGEVLSFTAFGIGQALLSQAHAGASLSDPGVARAVVGGGLYLAAVGVFGFALGAVIRHTAGALSAFFGLLFAPSALVELLPSSWHNAINYMPANAGSQIFQVHPSSSGALSPWGGFGLFCLYAAAALVVAAVLMVRRDT